MALATAAVMSRYPGSAGQLIAFSLTATLVASLIPVKPFSFFYLFLAGFLLLGFWAKLIVHLLGNYRYIEPTGGFRGTGPEWDSVLVLSSIGLAGLACSRLLQIGLCFPAAPAWTPTVVGVPRHVASLWRALTVLTVLGGAALFVANHRYGFMKIGMDAQWILPFRINVLLSWLVSWGFVLWTATLLHWGFLARRTSSLHALLFIALVGAVAAGSMGSRQQMILYVAAFVAVLLVYREHLALSRRDVAVGSGATLVLFMASLAFVTWDRLVNFPGIVVVESGQPTDGKPAMPGQNAPPAPRVEIAPPAPAPAPPPAPDAPHNEVSSTRIYHAAMEVVRLTIDRWIGLEGVMTVVGSPHRGPDLLKTAILESPNTGVDALYQRMAGSPYEKLKGRTFLSIPGVVAVFSYSGLPALVGFGVMLFFVLGAGIEALAGYLLRNPLVTALVGVATANAICQLNFPYLLLVFFIEMMASLIALWACCGVLDLRPSIRSAAGPAS